MVPMVVFPPLVPEPKLFGGHLIGAPVTGTHDLNTSSYTAT